MCLECAADEVTLICETLNKVLNTHPSIVGTDEIQKLREALDFVLGPDYKPPIKEN